MKIAIVTFEGFNEIDSFVSLNILNRVKSPDWKAEIVCPTEWVVSMNGVKIHSQRPFSFVNKADAVLIGSGHLTRKIILDESIMSAFQLNSQKQLIGSQCSGALVLEKLGLLKQIPACTDLATRPFLLETGVQVLDRSFIANGNIATAGGCLSAQYLAAWLIMKSQGRAVMENALSYVTPVSQHEKYISNILTAITPV